MRREGTEEVKGVASLLHKAAKVSAIFFLLGLQSVISVHMLARLFMHLFIWAGPGGVAGGTLPREWGWAPLKGGGVREKEDISLELVSCGERPGFLPAGLTALSRNVCDWRPGWGRALSLCKKAKQCDQPHGSRRWSPALRHTLPHLSVSSAAVVDKPVSPCYVCFDECAPLQALSERGVDNTFTFAWRLHILFIF